MKRACACLAISLLAACAPCARPAQATGPAHEPAPSQLDAIRVLVRAEKARLDGTVPPPSWPEPGAIRRVDTARGVAWVVDLDTSKLPGGYPEQIVVEAYGTGGHTTQPKL